MNTPALAQLETTNRVRKRAQYEAFEFTVESDGVTVRNGSHANPEDHEYLVTVTDGLPTDCQCPANAKYEGACKHRVAVAIRKPILDAVTLQTAEPRPEFVADGGPQAEPSTQTRDAESEDTNEEDCDCAYLSGDFPCWECFRTGRRDLPK